MGGRLRLAISVELNIFGGAKPMTDPRNIQIEDFNYLLPAELIAQYPLPIRDQSRLLVWKNGHPEEKVFTNLPSLLPPNATLVFNNTRVIRARFIFAKATGAHIEVFCLEPASPTADLQIALAGHHQSTWKAYVGNLKKWKNEVLELSTDASGANLKIWARKENVESDTVIVTFTWSNPQLSFGEVMELAGHIPLPPYIHRPDTPADASSYQTVYALQDGSVAAPTAGLHFTDRVLDDLKRNGIGTEWITLHVGAGTFKPVSSSEIGQHEMHSEAYIIRKDVITRLLASTLIIPVGTTSMRTLESLYWLGSKIMRSGGQIDLFTGQWEPYSPDNEQVSTSEALHALIGYMEQNKTDVIQASTALMIAPGYRFRLCRGLVTNFHLPKSTLLVLIAAIVGPDWKKAYEFALERKFRFLSYGDSSIFLPGDDNG